VNFPDINYVMTYFLKLKIELNLITELIEHVNIQAFILDSHNSHYFTDHNSMKWKYLGLVRVFYWEKERNG
jgi:hypothetical protein